jgi:uncharacterized protein
MPNAGEPPRPPSFQRRRRSRALAPTIVILVAMAGLFSLFASYWTDVLWFRSVRYSDVFTTQVLTRISLFVFFALAMALIVGANIVVAYRTRPPFRSMSLEQQSLDRYRATLEPFRRVALVLVAGGLGLVSGSAAASEWRTWLQWRNRTPFGVTDHQFHKDLGFYAFSYPWWRFLLGFAFAAVIMSLLLAVLTHYLYGGLRLQTPGDKATPAAQVHLSILLGLFVLLKAVAYWLDRYGLAIRADDRFQGWSGLKFKDVNAVLPAKTILFAIAIICALLFFANVFRRTWMLPGLGFGLLVLSAVLIGGVYPAIVQQFQVRPSEAKKEAPYIKRNIEATRQAYGLDKAQVQDYDAKTTATAGELRNDSDTTASLRLLDPSQVSPTFEQLQQIKGYYSVADPLDIDRYVIDGKSQDTIVALRELDLNGIPERNWINEHLKYTHGFGMIAARGNTREPDGKPTFIEGQIPPKGDLGKFEPRIYFGESSPSYSIVGAPAGRTPIEIDYPGATDQEQNNTYAGTGGVPMGSLFNQLLYALKLREDKILLSSDVTSASKILYVRHPRERVEKVAPWLTLDSDPYPAIVDGRILWIIDGYTSTSSYPYSTRSTLGEVTSDSLTNEQRRVLAPRDQVNYIRNSVKATVDAYDGTVTLYTWDEADPVLRTWKKAFPGTVKERGEISQPLMAHLRYPEDLFKVQRDLLSRYHVTDAQQFYGGADFWKIPPDPTVETATVGDQPPYYLTLKMPGQERPSFSLTSTFVPNRRVNLAAFMAVNAEPGPDYGTIRVLRLPNDTAIPGPGQVQNNFKSDSNVAQTVNLLQRGDSRVVYGNLLTLPVGGGLLYVEPVYVRATTGTSYPLLRKVLVAFGSSIAFEDTLQDALDKVFQGSAESPPPAPGGKPQPPRSGTGNAELRRALDDANAALKKSQEALKAGDFAAYGEAQKELQRAVDAALKAEQRGGAAKPVASPTPAPNTPASTAPPAGTPPPGGTPSPSSPASPTAPTTPAAAPAGNPPAARTQRAT